MGKLNELNELAAGWFSEHQYKGNYKDFYETSIWNEGRGLLIWIEKRRKGCVKCAICDKVLTKGIVIHHIKYDQTQIFNYLNVAFLCQDCHFKKHENRGKPSIPDEYIDARDVPINKEMVATNWNRPSTIDERWAAVKRNADGPRWFDEQPKKEDGGYINLPSLIVGTICIFVVILIVTLLIIG